MIIILTRIESLPNLLRWILALPLTIITYLLVITLSFFILNWFVGSPDESLGFYLIHVFSQRLVAVFSGIYLGSLMIPKRKLTYAIILASAVLIVQSVTLGYIIAVNSLTFSDWNLILEMILYVSGGILAVFAIVYENNRNKAIESGEVF